MKSGVGLEAMAAGGIVFTGGTGEDYAIPLHNAIVLETSDPKEIEACIMYLEEHPAAVPICQPVLVADM